MWENVQLFLGNIFSITTLHDSIEKLWVFLRLMAASGYPKALHLTDVSTEEVGRCAWHDLQARHSCLQTQFHHLINFHIVLDATVL